MRVKQHVSGDAAEKPAIEPMEATRADDHQVGLTFGSERDAQGLGAHT